MRIVPLLGLLAACAHVPPPPATPEPIVWIEDDYPAALELARKEARLLFVDAWAPWCHTCLSMKAYVFPDPSLAPYAGRFVWLALDTEREGNAAVVERFPVGVWPTLFVIDPGTERVVARWLGAATPQQLRRFLADAETTVVAGAEGPLALLAEAHAAAVARDHGQAAARYLAAAQTLPEARVPDALVGAIEAQYRAGDDAACVELGLARHGDTGRTASATDFLAFALACAERLDPSRDDVVRLRAAAAERLADLAGDPSAALSADDRGDAYMKLVDLRESLGEVDEARRAAERMLEVLGAAAAAAPDPIAASTFNYARLEAYLFLGRGDEAVAMLEASVAALPEHYDPVYRLASALHRLGRDDEALAAALQARELVYGPRTARVDALIAAIRGY